MTAATKEVTNGKGTATAVSEPTNHGEFTIDMSRPYVAHLKIQGTTDIIFHAWDCDDVEAKGKAAKGSAAKKTDNVESYVNRCPDGKIGIPSTYLMGSIINKQRGAAKYRQDPRSPRKSALDLYQAGVVPLTQIASIAKKDWDYLDKRRVVVSQSGITRVRPAVLAGWEASFDLQVLLPEYIAPSDLLAVLTDAGRLVGLAEMRPTYGRFQVIEFKVADI